MMLGNGEFYHLSCSSTVCQHVRVPKRSLPNVSACRETDHTLYVHNVIFLVIDIVPVATMLMHNLILFSMYKGSGQFKLLSMSDYISISCSDALLFGIEANSLCLGGSRVHVL